MYVSVSLSKSMDPATHLAFARRKVQSIGTWQELLLTNVWSPIIWKHDRRAKAEYLSCKYAALDFDSGEWTLETARTWCHEHRLPCIIGTSKSHGIIKGAKAACDRFRLIVPFAEVITDRLVYEATMKKLSLEMPCDKACVDAARYFFPCKTIHYAAGSTTTRQAGLAPAKHDEGQDVKVKHLATRDEDSNLDDPLPQWAQMALEFGPSVNEGRHKLCFRLGALLTLRGMTEDQIVEICMQGPLGEIGRADVVRAVENGANASRSEAVQG